MAIFPFVQFEFTHSLGPAPGRYVIVPADGVSPATEADHRPQQEPPGAGEDLRPQGSADVAVITVVGSRPASGRRLLGSRAKQAEVDRAPAEVALALATMIKATTELSESEAGDWLARLRDDWQEREQRIDEALATLNEVIAAHRAGARDPYALDVTRIDARAVRVGWGEAELVSKGRWSEALLAPAPRERKSIGADRVAPSMATASILARRTHVLDADELLGRAILDLDHGRPRAAAFQLSAAIESARLELAGELRADDRAAERLDTAEELLEPFRPAPGIGPGQDDLESLREVAVALDGAIAAWRESSDAVAGVS